MSFSKVSQIVNNIKFDEGFSAVDTMASLVGNRRFLTGYVDMVNQNDTAQAHIWTAISAVANDLGNTIYTNIQNYIDLASNVDTCKIVALRSMLDLEGLDYSLFQNINILPPEILQILDIMSIDRKILANSPYINRKFQRDFVASISSDHDLDEFAIKVEEVASTTLDTIVFDDEKYYNYISSTYYATLTGFLALEYNLTKGKASDHYYVYPSLSNDTSFDSYVVDSRREFKIKNNISPAFDECSIADAIENGTDRLDNYHAAEYQLIMMEIESRAEKLLATSLKYRNIAGFDSVGESVENKTRYSYYRKRKVQQYADFITEKYYFDTNLQTVGATYDHDPNYIELELTNARKNVIKNSPAVGSPSQDFDFEMIDKVANSLTKLTIYVSKLRQKIKKQVRKNYMKGTNNLLLYIINQYLLEYGINNDVPHPLLSDVYNNLATNSMKNMNVIEYYDKTDYYNLTTPRSKYSERNDTVERFWNPSDTYNSFNKDGIAYDCAQIEKFYLSTMMLKDGLDQISGLLDTVFDTGADDSYFDSDTGLYTTKLENGRYSIDGYAELTSVSAAYSTISGVIDFTGVTRPILSDAIADAEKQTIDNLSASIMSAVTHEYDDLMPRITALAQSVSELTAAYKSQLFDGQYAAYSGFTDPSDIYLYQKLVSLKSTKLKASVISNSPMLNAIDAITTQLTASTGLSASVKHIATSLTTSDKFVDPGYATLDDEFAVVIPFVENLISTKPSTAVQTYTQYLADLYSYQTAYDKLCTTFQNEYSSDRQTANVQGTSFSGVYSYDNLTSLRKMITAADETNLDIIKTIVQSMTDQYANLESQFIDLAKYARPLIGFDYSAQYIEQQIAELRSAVNTFTARRSKECADEFESSCQQFKTSLGVIVASLTDYLPTDTEFDLAVNMRLVDLNFLNDDYYKFNRDIMLTYGGQSFAYYPYYNYKNTTHPSYQIHPYLWNFIERNNVVTTSIAKLFQNIKIDALEFSNLLSTADDYFGAYGQSINIWRHFGALDYSGYITDYEYSKHNSSRSSLTSEVVDYDGPFYPPAVDMLTANYDSCMESLSSRQGEFYERFYRPLAFTDDELDYVIAQFDEYWKNSGNNPYITPISTIVMDRPLSSVYDIYRYGKDKFGNSYTLYKQYFTETPSYKEKKNTLGELWIRQKDQPISFPAFTGYHPVFDMTEQNTIPTGIQKISRLKIKQDVIPVIKDRMRYFFDFDLSESRSMLALVMLNRDVVPGIFEDSRGYNTSIGDNSYMTCYKMDQTTGYENAWIMAAPLVKKTVGKRALMRYIHTGEQRNSVVQSSFVRSGSCTSYSPIEVSRFGQTDSEYSSGYAFIGMYQTGMNGFNLVYVLKSYNSFDGFRIATDAPRNCRIINLSMSGASYDYAESVQPLNFGDNLYSDDICFTYDEQSGSLIFAVLTTIKDTDQCQTMTSSYVDLLKNTDGPVYDDPRRDLEMTSHDIFESNVTLVKTTIDGGEITARANTYSTYNMNADMAYRPSYPGLSGEFHHREPLTSTTTTQIELLGKSKSLAAQIALIDHDYDPYFDVEKIYDEYRFGRVYEDYLNDDNSLKILSNPLITDIVREPALVRGKDSYLLTVETSGFNYTDHNYDTTKLLFFNTRTAGKNPYLITDLTSIYVDTPESEIWYDTMYNEELSGDLVSETELSGQQYDIRIAGTYTGLKRNSYDSNYIFNFKTIKVRFVKSTKQFQIRFDISDPSLLEYTHIDEDVLKMVFFNICDLQIFKYYHYLDAYGAANARSAKYGIDTVKMAAAEPWRVVYNQSNVHDRDIDTIIGDISSYYLYKNTEYFLADLDLRDYDYLSDVYILQTADRLSFKIDEDEFWPLSSRSYYYPVLNIKYPKVLADYVNDMNPYKTLFNMTSSFVRVLTDQNTFILDLVAPDDVKDKLTDIQIPILRTSDEGYLVYEDFLEKDENGFYNYKKYAANDVRNLPYLQCTELADNELVHALEGDALAELTSSYPTIPSFLDVVSLSCPDICVLRTQQSTQYASTEFVNVNVTSDDINIDDFVKLYVNYARTDKGIVLYFNYYNYIDTPFIKMKDNKVYSDIIRGTYLSVEPNQSGFLNIVVQPRYYAMDEVYGYTNINLMTYQIFNVSDDKPKFIVKRANTLPQSTFIDPKHAFVEVAADNGYINIGQAAATSDDPDNTSCDVDITIHITASTALSSRFQFEFVYPSDILQFNGLGSTYQYDTQDFPDEGYISISSITSSLREVNLQFKTKLSVKQLQPYIEQRFLMYVDEIDVCDSHGAKLSAVTHDAYLGFALDFDEFLQIGYDSKSKTHDLLAAGDGMLVSLKQ